MSTTFLQGPRSFSRQLQSTLFQVLCRYSLCPLKFQLNSFYCAYILPLISCTWSFCLTSCITNYLRIKKMFQHPLLPKHLILHMAINEEFSHQLTYLYKTFVHYLESQSNKLVSFWVGRSSLTSLRKPHNSSFWLISKTFSEWKLLLERRAATCQRKEDGGFVLYYK